MKLRPLLVLLLFVVSAGILVWIYYANTHDQPAVHGSPWKELITDLDACSRNKHVKAAQFDHFAEIAVKEGKSDAASLFRAMAFSERLNEQNCANALVRLGGSYQPPVRIVVFRSTTDDNLSRSITYEQQTLDAVNGADIRRAFDRGNRYVARVLIWAAAGDMRHIALMKAYQNKQGLSQTPAVHRRASSGRDLHLTSNILQRSSVPVPPQKEMGAADSGPQYLVCPVCGNIYAAELCDVYCPFCLTDCRLFVEFQ